MLCTDGLSNAVSDDEVESLVRSSQTVDSLIDGLMELALANGNDDNISVVVAEVIT